MKRSASLLLCFVFFLLSRQTVGGTAESETQETPVETEKKDTQDPKETGDSEKEETQSGGVFSSFSDTRASQP